MGGGGGGGEGRRQVYLPKLSTCQTISMFEG